jgi:hypothetical protein
MNTKKILAVENIIIFAGLGYLAYWYFKKPKGVININPKMGESVKPVQDKKTIVLDLSGNKKNNGVFPQAMAKDYDYRESRTFAPARTTINEF